MKRMITVLLAIMTAAALFVGCGSETTTDTNDAQQTKDSDSLTSWQWPKEEQTIPTEPDDTVRVTVSQLYDDGLAKNYAKSVSTDLAGNTVYEFTEEKYEDFVFEHAKRVGNEIISKAAEIWGPDCQYSYQYVYIKTNENSVIIGVNLGEYNADAAQDAVPRVAEIAFKFFKSVEQPPEEIRIIYCNANDQSDVFGTFEVAVD